MYLHKNRYYDCLLEQTLYCNNFVGRQNMLEMQLRPNQDQDQGCANQLKGFF